MWGARYVRLIPWTLRSGSEQLPPVTHIQVTLSKFFSKLYNYIYYSTICHIWLYFYIYDVNSILPFVPVGFFSLNIISSQRFSFLTFCPIWRFSIWHYFQSTFVSLFDVCRYLTFVPIRLVSFRPFVLVDVSSIRRDVPFGVFCSYVLSANFFFRQCFYFDIFVGESPPPIAQSGLQSWYS